MKKDLNTTFMLGLENEDGEVEPVKALPSAPKEKRFRLKVEEEENGLNYISPSINGVAYQIMRGVEVEVPESVIHVLEQAKATRLAQERLPDGTVRTFVKSFNRYPYTILGPVEA